MTRTQIRNGELLSLHRALVAIAESSHEGGLSLLAVQAGYVRRSLAPQVDSVQEALDKIVEAHAEKDEKGQIVSPEPGTVKITDVKAFNEAQAPVLTGFAELPRFKPLSWPDVEKSKAKLSAQMIDALLAANLLAGLPDFMDDPNEPAHSGTPTEPANAG